jgi:RNA polymerase sigma-70 factor (sigma-E family)
VAKPDWESEFTGYFTARAAAMRRLAYALCGDWHAADDLAQLTFVRLYRHWPRIRSETVDAYAHRVLINTFLTRRRLRRNEQIVAQVPDRAVPVADHDGVVDLGRALSALPARQRAMVVLRYLEDLPVAAVADLLGVAEGTVTSQTARALRSLRANLVTPLTKE